MIYPMPSIAPSVPPPHIENDNTRPISCQSRMPVRSARNYFSDSIGADMSRLTLTHGETVNALVVPAPSANFFRLFLILSSWEQRAPRVPYVLPHDHTSTTFEAASVPQSWAPTLSS
jgi:hypothetical protein